MAKSNWVIDPLHSDVQFKIKHLVISTVTGSFNKFSGSVATDREDFENADIDFIIDVASIDTNQPQRDEHLLNGDFFEAEKYPDIRFHSTSFRKKNEDTYTLNGNLTMKGVTKPLELEAALGGSAKDQYGNTKYGFEVTGIINRKDYGMTYNALTEAGGLALGEQIKLTANIQLAQAAAGNN